MSHRPIVSIITPSYNQAAYLENTIRSVLAQDYPYIEYLVVDGGSTDGSVEIIQKYASLAPDRLSWWVSEPDAGQAEAINKGLKRASGAIVAWLNSDDIYLPSAIRQAAHWLEDDPGLGFVFSDAITINTTGKPLNRLAFENWGLSDLASFRIICQPAVFMRRSILEEAGYLDPSFHFMLDHHLWLRMASLAPIRYAPNELWAAARHHPAAKNVAQAKNFSEEILRLMDWLQSQPELLQSGPLIQKPLNPRHVTGGAYRLRARYLLDSGAASEALHSYWRALLAWPGFALRHWRRMLYAAWLVLRLKPLAELTDRMRSQQSAEHSLQLTQDLVATLNTLLAQQNFTPDILVNTVTASVLQERNHNWPGLNLTLSPGEDASHVE